MGCEMMAQKEAMEQGNERIHIHLVQRLLVMVLASTKTLTCRC